CVRSSVSAGCQASVGSFPEVDCVDPTLVINRSSMLRRSALSPLQISSLAWELAPCLAVPGYPSRGGTFSTRLPFLATRPLFPEPDRTREIVAPLLTSHIDFLIYATGSHFMETRWWKTKYHRSALPDHHCDSVSIFPRFQSCLSSISGWKAFIPMLPIPCSSATSMTTGDSVLDTPTLVRSWGVGSGVLAKVGRDGQPTGFLLRAHYSSCIVGSKWMLSSSKVAASTTSVSRANTVRAPSCPCRASFNMKPGNSRFCRQGLSQMSQSRYS